MNCTICGFPTGNIVGSVLPQCKCGWQAPQPPKAQRQWVGLTDEEIYEIADSTQFGISPHDDTLRFAMGISAKLKEKNSG